MRRTTAAAGVLFTAALSFGFSGTANAADTYNCPHFVSQADAQAVYNADPSDPHGLDGNPGPSYTGVQGVACEDHDYVANPGTVTSAMALGTTSQVAPATTSQVAPATTSQVAPATTSQVAPATTSQVAPATTSQVTTRPAGAVAAGDGSSSGDHASTLLYVVGGIALTAAGGAAVAARRSSRTTV
jgi:cobalamin biosynthesis Mg chelatase CobN